jgi:hypothetical protein
MHSLSRLPCVPEQPGVIVADNASSDDTVALIEAGCREYASCNAGRI